MKLTLENPFSLVWQETPLLPLTALLKNPSSAADHENSDHHSAADDGISHEKFSAKHVKKRIHAIEARIQSLSSHTSTTIDQKQSQKTIQKTLKKLQNRRNLLLQIQPAEASRNPNISNFYVGLNSVTKALEKSIKEKSEFVSIVFLCKNDIEPPHLYTHLYTLGYLSNTRIACLPAGSEYTLAHLLGIKTCMCLGLKVGADQKFTPLLTELQRISIPNVTWINRDTLLSIPVPVISETMKYKKMKHKAYEVVYNRNSCGNVNKRKRKFSQ